MISTEDSNAVQTVVDFLSDWRYCPLARSENPSLQCLEETAKQLLEALNNREEAEDEDRGWDLDNPERTKGQALDERIVAKHTIN